MQVNNVNFLIYPNHLGDQMLSNLVKERHYFAMQPSQLYELQKYLVCNCVTVIFHQCKLCSRTVSVSLVCSGVGREGITGCGIIR